MKKIYLSFIFTISILSLVAQDPIFTNSNSNDNIYNPASSGLYNDIGATLAYRQIYPSINQYSNYGVNINGLFRKPKIGIGLSALRYYEGNGSIVTNLISLNFNKILKINRKLKFSIGMNAGFLSSGLNLEDDIFSNQLDPVLGVLPTATIPSVKNEILKKLNIATGMSFLYDDGKNIHTIGLSINHLNMPNIAHVDNNSYYLPMFYSISYKSIIDIEKRYKKIKLRPRILFTYQKKSTNIILGTDIIYNNFLVGTGIRFKNYQLSKNLSYLEFNIGFSINSSVLFVYSFETPDLTLVHTGGLHEISLNYFFSKKKKRICY